MNFNIGDKVRIIDKGYSYGSVGILRNILHDISVCSETQILYKVEFYDSDHSEYETIIAYNIELTKPQLDVKAIRQSLNMSQAEFARRFGFSIDSLQNWEQGRRFPDKHTKTLLRVIEKHPDIVENIGKEIL